MEMKLLMQTAAEVLDHVYDGVAAIDDAGMIVYVNPANERITGLKGDALIGRHVRDAIPSTHIYEVLLVGEPLIGVRTQVAERQVVSNIVPVRQEGKLVGVVSIFRDETEVLELSRQLTRANETIEHLERLIDAEKTRPGLVVGASKTMQNAVLLAQKAARVASPVLIQGESGTGKEVMARFIHEHSPRRDKPFLAINCAAIPESLLESELFGYEEGAFTGSRKGGRQGVFEEADGGTLLLDEVGDMSLPLQAKLLRALQFQEIKRVGSTRTRQVNIRFLFATHHRLRDKVAQGLFREDLFYRMEVVTITMPPLRERKEDVPLFAAHALTKITRKLGLPRKKIGEDAMAALIRHHWPGNVRELENVLEQAAILDEDGTLGLADLPERFRGRFPHRSGGSFPKLEEMERQLLQEALDRFATKGEAADALGISRATLYRKLEKYDLFHNETFTGDEN